jgi:hypothetical protein
VDFPRSGDWRAPQVWDCSQLTGLRELNLNSIIDTYADRVGLLLQLTQLRQLTQLSFTAVEWDMLVFEGEKLSPCSFDHYTHGIVNCKVSLALMLWSLPELWIVVLLAL